MKAGAVIRSMNHDKDNIMCSKFQLLTQPMQEYLNKVQEADSAVCALVTAVAVDPSAEDTLKLRRKCIKLNKAVISGDVGRAMLGKYVELINDLDHPKWSLCGAHATEKNECILGMFRMLNDGWRRCVFYFEATRFLPLQTLVNPDDPWDFDGGVVEKLKSDLQSIQDRCQECLCAFAEAFLSLASAEPRLAHDTVEHALAFIRLGSAVVERAHLPGSELYKNRQRGVGPAALALGSLTYLKSSVQETAALAKYVKASVFKNRGLTEQQFQRLSATHRVGGIIKRTEVEETSAKHRANNVNKMMRALTGESKQRKSDAFREFRSRSWNVRAKVGSPAFKAEQQRISALWETQKDGEERFVWDSYAGDTNHAISDLLGEKLNYHDITTKSGGVLSDSTGRALKRKLFLETSKEINEHQAWRRGLGIQDSCSALSSQCVDVSDLDEKHWKRQVLRYFSYNDKEVANPAGSHRPRRSCSVKRWGRCSTDASFQQCDIATYNCWVMLRRWKLARNRFPLKIRLSCPHGAADFLLTDYFGSGDTILLLRLCPCDGGGVGVANLPHSLTGQRAFIPLLDGKLEGSPEVATVKFEHFSLQSARAGRTCAFRSGTDPVQI